MTTTPTTPLLTTPFLSALVALATLAGLKVTDNGDVFRGARAVWIVQNEDLSGFHMEVRVGARSGKVLGARVFPYGEDYSWDATTAQEVAEALGQHAAETLPRHEEDQPVPAAGTLVMYHGSLGAVRGVYKVLGDTDNAGRHYLRPTWSIEAPDQIRVSVGCRTITPLPLP